MAEPGLVVVDPAAFGLAELAGRIFDCEAPEPVVIRLPSLRALGVGVALVLPLAPALPGSVCMPGVALTPPL